MGRYVLLLALRWIYVDFGLASVGVIPPLAMVALYETSCTFVLLCNHRSLFNPFLPDPFQYNINYNKTFSYLSIDHHPYSFSSKYVSFQVSLRALMLTEEGGNTIMTPEDYILHATGSLIFLPAYLLIPNLCTSPEPIRMRKQ